MNGKRFLIVENDKNYLRVDDKTKEKFYLNEREIVKCLNALSDENEQLKKEAEEYNENAMSYQTLYEQQLEKSKGLLLECKHQQEQKMKFYNENKELKQTIQRLKGNIDELLSVNVEKELLEENKQLKKEMWYLGTAHAEEISKVEDEFDEEILKLEKENEQLQARNDRQAKRLGELYEFMAKKDWESLTEIIDDFKRCEEQLQREWGTYGDWE